MKGARATTIPISQWKSYEIRERGDAGEVRAGPCVIVAPSPGVAIEYFLAIHGMIGYSNIFVRDGRDAVPDETAAQVLAVMPIAGELVAELDAHHNWRWLLQPKTKCDDPAHWMLHDGVETTPVVYNPDCYICTDPEYAQMGLPLCRKCPYCSGHVAADNDICDDCGRNEREYYESQREEQVA